MISLRGSHFEGRRRRQLQDALGIIMMGRCHWHALGPHRYSIPLALA